jgi:signal transduction histidine kinase
VGGKIYAKDDSALTTLSDEEKRGARGYQGHITVADLGEGMSPETIRNGWLVISVSAKREFKAKGKLTKIYHRTPLGDKGLGRLGTMKLGSVLRIVTQTEGATFGTDVSFSWDDCVSGRTLSEVPVDIHQLPPKPDHGTTITIIGLRDIAFWQSHLELIRLERQLSTLISPFSSFESFKVDIQVDGNIIRHQDAQEYLEMALDMFELTWDSAQSILETRCSVKLDLFQVKRKDDFFEQYVVTDGGARLFAFLRAHKDTKGLNLSRGSGKWFVSFATEKKKDALGELLNSNDREDPGPLAGSVYSFTVDPFRRAPMGADLPKVPDFVKEHSGVFVFRDNFRIRMGEDWLQLGANVTTGASYYGLRPKNTLGWIALSARENQKLVEKSDREGFVDNKAKRGFDYLTFEFRDTINSNLEALRRTYIDFRKEIENEVAGKPPEYGIDQAEADLESAKIAATAVAGRLRELSGALQKSRAMAASLSESVTSNGSGKETTKTAAHELLMLLESLEPLSRQIAAIAEELSSVEVAVNTMKAEIDSMAYRIEDLHHFAAIGVSANALIHELPNRIAETVYGVDSAITIFQKMQIKNSRLYEILERIKVNAAQIGDRIRFMDPMLRNQRNRKENVAIANVFSSIQALFQSELDSSRIKFNTVLGGPFVVRLNRGRLTQVFDNLVRNSIYWLQYFGKQVPATQLEITVEIERPKVIFSDNGYGIDPRLEDRLFDIFVSGRSGETGQGMGLFIARELMAADGCSIRLLPERNQHKRRYKFELSFDSVVIE